MQLHQMNENSSSGERVNVGFNCSLKRISLFVLCLLLSGCQATKVLTPAIVTACGTSTTYLSDWWARVPDPNAIQYDPMGGYQLLYWLDDANNVCHGNPGSNGQPGVAVIKAFSSQAWESAKNESPVTPDQLKAFQAIPVPLDKYLGSGMHFVQFYNTLARNRSDSKAFRFSNVEISIPNVIEVGQRSCIFPIVLRVTNLASLPSQNPPNPNSQDPNICKVRAIPRETTMSEEDRKHYDAGSFPHGTEIFNVPE